MSQNGFKVMDSDMHIMEPGDLFERYMEPAYRGRLQIRTRWERDLGPTLDGLPLNSNSGSYTVPTPASVAEGILREREDQNPKYQDAEDHGWDSGSQIRAMDQEGIDVAVLYPTRGLFSMAVDGMDPGLAAAADRAYNDWMFDFCKEHPDRLYGAGHIPPHDVEAAVSETRRCGEECDQRRRGGPTSSTGVNGMTPTTILCGRSASGRGYLWGSTPGDAHLALPRWETGSSPPWRCTTYTHTR